MKFEIFAPLGPQKFFSFFFYFRQHLVYSSKMKSLKFCPPPFWDTNLPPIFLQFSILGHNDSSETKHNIYNIKIILPPTLDSLIIWPHLGPSPPTTHFLPHGPFHALCIIIPYCVCQGTFSDILTS